MKVRHAITLIVLGFCLDFVGALQRVLHHPSAATILIAATVLKVSGSLLFLYKLSTYPKTKEFLEW